MNKKKEVEIPIHLDISKELEHEIKNIDKKVDKILSILKK